MRHLQTLILSFCLYLMHGSKQANFNGDKITGCFLILSLLTHIANNLLIQLKMP